MSWSTHDELSFVRGLGNWRRLTLPTNEEQIELLTQYKKSCERRAHWGEVDRQEVLAEVNRLIDNLRPKKKPSP